MQPLLCTAISILEQMCTAGVLTSPGPGALVQENQPGRYWPSTALLAYSVCLLVRLQQYPRCTSSTTEAVLKGPSIYRLLLSPASVLCLEVTRCMPAVLLRVQHHLL